MLLVFLSCGSLFAEAWNKLNGPSGGSFYFVEKINNTLFTAAFGSGIYKSTDNGNSWEYCGLDRKIVFALQHIGDTLYAATRSSEVYQSTDNGNTWKKILQRPPESAIFKIHHNTLFLGGYAAVIYVSHDAGKTWDEWSTKMVSFYDLTFLDTSLYIAAGHLAKSEDDTIIVVNKQPLDSTPVIATTIAAHDSVLYIGYDDGVLYSRDGGITCFPIQSGLPVPDKKQASGSNKFIIYSLQSTSRGVMAGTSHGLFTLDSLNSKWERIDSLRAGRLTYNFGVHDDAIFICDGSHGLYRSRHPYHSWETASHGIFAVRTYAMETFNNDIFAVTGRRTLMQYHSTTWTELFQDIHAVLPLHISSNSTTLYCSSDSHIYRNNNTLSTWDTIDVVSEDTLDSYYKDICATEGYLFTVYDNLYRLRHGATQWERMTDSIPYNSGILLFENEGRLFLGNKTTELETSDDQGETFQSRPVRNIVCMTAQKSTVYAASNKHETRGLYRSFDNGTSWHQIIPRDTLYYYTSLESTNDLVFIGAHGAGVMVSQDSGTTWETMMEGLEYWWITTLLVVDSLLYAGVADHGIWVYDLSTLNASTVSSSWRHVTHTTSSEPCSPALSQFNIAGQLIGNTRNPHVRKRENASGMYLFHGSSGKKGTGFFRRYISIRNGK